MARRLGLWFDGGEESLRVRAFSVHEALSRPFEISVRALSPRDDIDLEQITGKPAALHVFGGVLVDDELPVRQWSGVCSQAQLVHAEPMGHSTYHLRIVPELWLLSQRRSHRLFHHQSLPDIVTKVLAEWAIEPQIVLGGTYPKHEMVVQYGETDLDFVSRLLEWAGITYFFSFDGGKTKLVLSDEPHGGDAFRRFPYVERPEREQLEYLTRVRLRYEVRPGALSIRDHDFRRQPDVPVTAAATPAAKPEDFFEQYHYRPGAFWVHAQGGAAEPMADDKGMVRHDEADYGKGLAERALAALRRDDKLVVFTGNSLNLAPGRIFGIHDYPHPEIPDGENLLCSEYWISGDSDDEWSFAGEALFCRSPHYPERRTEKPRVLGVQSALVVGPKGQEIHTDEHGRVRVQFHWDRDGKYDDKSSCWMRVSQAWAGAGFGTVHIPRIGQEVLVGFLDGEPDRPMVVGRVYDSANKVPYTLPEHKTRSTWKSNSTPDGSGFNEILYDDKKGGELVYLQAQKDMQKLVKQHESERTGQNRHIVVGYDRSEIIGKVDATLVGEKMVLQAVKLATKQEIEEGVPPVTPLPTLVAMSDSQIIFTTGKATVALDGDKVMLDASGDVHIKAKGGDVVVRGSTVFVNTLPAPPPPELEQFQPHGAERVAVHAPVKKPKLEARPVERQAREPGAAPPAPPPSPEAPAALECVFKSADVHCQHDGRRPNPDTGVLEVVAAELGGDTITLKSVVSPACGKHPEWQISTPFGQKTEQAANTSINVRPWNVIEPTATMVLRWLSRVNPKQYSAWVKSCSGQSRHYVVRAFPSDRLQVKWTPFQWRPAKKLVDMANAAVQAYFPKAKFEALIGDGISIEAQWVEWEDWRVFYKFVANVGFDPLLELKLRVPLGPTAAVPGFIKKWVGDITFFVEFFGQVAVTASFGRDNPDGVRIGGGASGAVGGRLGGMIQAGSAVEVECFGETAINATAEPHIDDAKGPYAALGVVWTGLVGTVKVSVWNGKIEKQYNLQIINQRTIKRGNWYFLGNEDS